MSFLTDFFGVVEGAREISVCCPFDHFTASGLKYKETHPSAHINTHEKLFHCKVCGTGYSEAQFIRIIFGCSLMDARRLQRCFDTSETETVWQQETSLSEEDKALAISYGISEEVLAQLQVASAPGAPGQLVFPLFMYGHLVDVRTYCKDATPKVRGRIGSVSGTIMPFDLWQAAPVERPTLICAGEKDMAVARSHGFNAITILGGEGCLPKFLSSFEGRDVIIVYDHDAAGIRGARRLAWVLHTVAAKVRVCTGFHEVCKEEKEDITDFFTKYGKTRRDLVQYLNATPEYIPNPEDGEAPAPVMDLVTASKANNIGKLVRANIQVVSVSEATYMTPAGIIAEKYQLCRDPRMFDTMALGEVRDWELDDDNIADILHLMDNNFTEDQIDNNIRDLLHIPRKERYVRVKSLGKHTIFKGAVTDMFETNSANSQPMEFTAYSVDEKLESGKKYMATFRLVPHPYKGQQLIMVITKLVQANDSVTNFHVTPEIRQHLDVFRQMPGSALERLHEMSERFKGVLGYNGNNVLISVIDLAYHTPLMFHFGTFRNVRGYLDTLVVGESRIGKSSTAEAMRNMYGLGTFTSLAGNSATVSGLIGGSNKTATGYQTRAGVIPQNHRGLLIFEEFGKAPANLIGELTDIRSSNEVRIARVSGTISMPAMVRMITLSNVKHRDGNARPIAGYPNGIAVVTELVDSAEDVARYDLLVVLSDKGAHHIDPFWEPKTPFTQEQYRARIRWVWSRTPEQIQITREVGLYLMEQANALNRDFECHLKIFGTEAWKKLSRLSIAIAGMLVSTDDGYENLIVEKEHVDAAVQLFRGIYDNPTFKLREYVLHERQYSQLDDDGIAMIQDIYTRFPQLVQQLEKISRGSKHMLQAATGLGQEELNRALNRLSRGLFIKFDNFDIVPTERFRMACTHLNRNLHVPEVGEL